MTLFYMKYILAHTIIVIEFASVFLMILLTYIIKISLNMKDQKIRQSKLDLKQYFLFSISANRKKSIKFQSRWKRLDVLIPVIQELNHENTMTEWYEFRNDFIHKIVLPLARKNYRKSNWVKRYFSAQAFEMAAEDKDTICIETLVKDRIPLVYLHASNAAMRYGSNTARHTIIKRMASEAWLSQSMLLRAFDNPSEYARAYFINAIQSLTDAAEKASCYKILRKFPVKPLIPEVHTDIHSPDKELRLAALKYMAHTDKEASIPALMNALDDLDWEIRLVAIYRLGAFHALQSISSLRQLSHDENPWVQMAAINTLKKMGEAGVKALAAENIAFTTSPRNINPN